MKKLKDLATMLTSQIPRILFNTSHSNGNNFLLELLLDVTMDRPADTTVSRWIKHFRHQAWKVKRGNLYSPVISGRNVDHQLLLSLN